jgi:2-iminoacetate synthase ThiH
MKRPGGLDKYGKPMSVRGGVADIIDGLESGGMILCLSGGLHHVQQPGQFFPRLFKTIRMNFAYLDIADFKKHIQGSHRERKLRITQELQSWLQKCPESTLSK